MFSTSLRLCLTSLLLLATAQGLRVETSKDFPLGSEVENLAIRPSGSALAVVYTFPNIFEVQVAANAEPKLVHTFEGASGVSSIAKSSTPDVYTVITGNFSFDTFTPTPGSYAIHSLSIGKRNKPIVKKLASLEAVSQPNGIEHVPNTPYVLIADTRAGLIYKFNTKTLELTTYFDHPLLSPGTTTGVVFGVNGIKLSRGYLYFSNTNQQLVARVKASGKEKSLKGEPEIVAKEAPVDDILVNEHNGDLYLAQLNINALGYVARAAYGTVPQILFGGGNSTELLGPTALRWAKGAEGRTLVVTSVGGFEQFVTHNYTGGGKLNFVHLD